MGACCSCAMVAAPDAMGEALTRREGRMHMAQLTTLSTLQSQLSRSGCADGKLQAFAGQSAGGQGQGQ